MYLTKNYTIILTYSLSVSYVDLLYAHFRGKVMPGIGVGENCLSPCTMVYPKVSGLAAWNKNCKWHSSLPLGAVISLLYESV
jgi:hypothetical protein